LGLNLAGATTLAETAAVIKKSALLLSGDSGVLHIAVGLGVPTVSLFGPGRVKKWAPQGEHHIVINKELPCSPCTTFGHTPPCPIHAQCMRDISVDEVVTAVTMLLTSGISCHPIFGMNRQTDDSVEAVMKNMRGGRYDFKK
jgi:ADP-heptose:LPS heptosyltransferase